MKKLLTDNCTPVYALHNPQPALLHNHPVCYASGMKKTAYILFTSLLFFGSASFALADVSPLSFYCAPYTTPFLEGESYTPLDHQSNGCIFTPLVEGQSTTYMLFRGTPGNSPAFITYVTDPTGSQNFAISDVVFTGGTEPVPGESYFWAAFPGDVDAWFAYFETGGTPPAPGDYSILNWHWGAPMTVTADTQTIAVGDTLPALTVTLSGFIDGDSLGTSGIAGSASCTTTAADSGNAGDYPITCTRGDLSSDKYAFDTFVDGTLHIVAPPPPTSPLTVTADNETITFGDPLPVFTATLSGFVNGDTSTSNDVTGSAGCASTATASSPAGNYPITCTIGTLVSAGHYSFSAFVPGTLTIEPSIIHATGPMITITDPVANHAYTQSDNVILGDTIVDTVPIVSTTTLFNGIPFDPKQPIPFFSASPGTSTVTVAALDAGGLWATSSVQFLITRPGGDQCYSQAQGWWNRGWVWTSDDFYHVFLDCSDLDNFHRDRHDLENNHNHDSNWKQKDRDVSDGVKQCNDDIDKRVHKNGH